MRVDEYAATEIVHAEGLNFAINIDSAQFQVFAAAANTSGFGSWGVGIVPNPNRSNTPKSASGSNAPSPASPKVLVLDLAVAGGPWPNERPVVL